MSISDWFCVCVIRCLQGLRGTCSVELIIFIFAAGSAVLFAGCGVAFDAFSVTLAVVQYNLSWHTSPLEPPSMSE